MEASPHLGYGGFPGTLCIEVNETVVHGFPSGYELRDGDIIGIDTVVELDGYHGDMCYTFPVGEIAPRSARTLQSHQGISLPRNLGSPGRGKRIGDIANTIQTYCERHGCSVVREILPDTASDTKDT